MRGLGENCRQALQLPSGLRSNSLPAVAIVGNGYFIRRGNGEEMSQIHRHDWAEAATLSAASHIE
jgi:hypothetical protein